MPLQTPPPLDFWKDVAIIAGGIVALVTFFFGYLEYIRQGRQHSAAAFVQMRRRFLESDRIQHILKLLTSDDPTLQHISIQDRRNFLGFFEEIALMVNSKMIRIDIAHYMFGYYILLADRSQHLWHELDRESPYWTVFNEFVRIIRAMDRDPHIKPRSLGF